MIEAGTILQERYRVEKQIGQGGMGTVFVAVDERFGSKVAIKETFFDDENLKKAFEREARLLNSLKHPALPKVNDFFTEDDSQFIVMEYIAGEDLSTILEKSGEAFPVEDVLNWGDQLCDALEYLHSQEMPVIHRDIKPQNLKLTPKGQIILLDFGLAKGNPTDASHHTAAKSIFGFSRNYASLEQIQGTGTDPQSDLYSLAATLYHLASGVPPADALTRAMNVLNAQSDPLISAYKVNRNIPKGVAEVFQKTMALNAAERPSSAGEMRSMLTECNKNIVFDEELTNSEKLVSTELLNQETKLMSAETNVGNPVKPEEKTEVLPLNLADENSLETKVIEKAGTTQDKEVTFAGTAVDGSRSGKRTFAAVASVLLLIVGAVSGFYVYNAQNSSASQEMPKVENPKMPLVNEISDSNSNTDFAEFETPEMKENLKSDNPTTSQDVSPDMYEQMRDENAKTVEKKEKPQKSGSGESKETKMVKSADGRTRVVVSADGDEIIVNGDKIEIDEMVFDDDGIFDKKSGKRLFTKGETILTREQIEQLTPNQRRKMREAQRLRLEKMKELEDLKIPRPPKTRPEYNQPPPPPNS